MKHPTRRSTSGARDHHSCKWINFAVTANDFSGKNDDPFVNHVEHNHDVSFATQIIPTETLSLDFNYAHDDVYSRTDLCYIFVATSTYPLPPGAMGSTGTCVQTADNPGGTLPTAPASSQPIWALATTTPQLHFSLAALTYAPSKFFRFNGGARS